MERTKEIIENVNKYLNFTRFKYLTEEKLSRLTILDNYYTLQNKQYSIEKLSVEVESAESLSKDFKLPLKVKGIFLTEGKPKNKYYTKESLKAAVSNVLNKTFPMCLDHKDKEVGSIVGKVDKIEYDDSIKGIRYYGHINSETVARNILDGVIKDVSATIYSSDEYNKELGIMTANNLTFTELSLVLNGAEKNNSIEPVI